MTGRTKWVGPDVPNGEEGSRTSSIGASITRRRYLVVGAALPLVAGCVGDTDDPSDDEATPADDDEVAGTADDSADDPSAGSDEESETTLEVREDVDSYVLEMEVTHQGPEGDWTQRLYREADVTNERLYQQLEMAGDEGEAGVFEHFIVDGEAYQLLPDGTCTSFDETTIRMYGENVGGFERPKPDEIDEDAEHVTYGDTTTVAWVDEPVHVWEIDLEPTVEAIDGMMQLYVGVESGYFVGYEGWYTTGAHDDPAEITIEYHQHSFNQDLEIELHDECTDV